MGLTKGAIYSHFDSKEGLCYAVLEKAGRMIQDKVAPPTLKARLTLVTSFWRWYVATGVTLRTESLREDA